MNFDAAFFDMDGTLVASERLYSQTLCRALKIEGLDLDEVRSLQLVYGRAWFCIYRDLLDIFPELPLSESELDDLVLEQFNQIGKPDGFIIEGSRKLLIRLAEEMPVGIVSGSTRHHLDVFVESLGIAEHLQCIISPEDYDEGKPSPQPYLEAAQRLNVQPDRCVVFEDSCAGVLSAKAAGMFCVALKRLEAIEQDVSPADQIRSDLEEWI